MLQVLEALILYLKLEGVDKERRVVQDIDCCDIDGCHAYFSGLTHYQNLKCLGNEPQGRILCCNALAISPDMLAASTATV